MGWFLIIVGLILIGIFLYITIFAYNKDSNNPEQKKEEVASKYTPSLNRFQARRETTVATARGELLEATNKEQSLIDANQEREEDADVRSSGRKVEYAKHENEVLELEARNELIKAALAQKMDVTTYLQVTSHRELKQIDLEARDVEYQQDQEQISRVQQEKLELIDRASHRLYSMYEERKRLEASDDPAKDDKLRHLNKLIHGGEVLILGEQDRFIQTTLGEEAQRSLSASDSPASDTEESESAEEQIPTKKRRGRRPRNSMVE